jgi:glucose-1-phosphate cytidylyltransferase
MVAEARSPGPDRTRTSIQPEGLVKAVILAGGLGTRIAEESMSRPKPLVEIGCRPLLWHIMKLYASHDIQEFIVCLGYKGHMIKEYFSNYFLHMCDLTLDMRSNARHVHCARAEPWKVTLVDTGEHTMTGGRLKRVRHHLGDEVFCFTYGDGLADIDMSRLVAFHHAAGTLATVTAIHPLPRFGVLRVQGDRVVTMREKPPEPDSWINGGFFVLSPQVIDEIDGDDTSWEEAPLRRLAEAGELAAFRHTGFWQPMDTLRDRIHLEHLWNEGKAPWKRWT